MQVPSYLGFPLIADRVGRPRAWALLLAATALALFILGAITPSRLGHAATLALTLAARFCIAGAASVNYLAAAEQFPTSSRSVGMAFAGSCGRLGTILAPPIARVLSAHSQQVVLASGTALGALCVFALPETLGAPMPESVLGARRVAAHPTFGGVAASSRALTS